MKENDEAIVTEAAKKISRTASNSDFVTNTAKIIQSVLDKSRQEEKAAEKHERIYSRCPACFNDTLTINDNHLLCTWISCPNPTLIDSFSREAPTPHSDLLRAEFIADHLVNANLINREERPRAASLIYAHFGKSYDMDVTMRTCLHHGDIDRAEARNYDDGVHCPVCRKIELGSGTETVVAPLGVFK